MRTLSIVFFLIWCTFTAAQNLPADTIIGNIKRVREQVFYLNDSITANSEDYGHMGFINPKYTTDTFFSNWYSSKFCSYINYDKYYDSNRKVTKEIWYGKDNPPFSHYHYQYDDQGRIKFVIDSTYSLVIQTVHFYTEYGDENIYTHNKFSDLYSHSYRKFKSGKLSAEKDYTDDGIVIERKYYYTPTGKLKYRLYKDPLRYRWTDERDLSYGIQDSIITAYKDRVYFYNDNDQLIQIDSYRLSDNPDDPKPNLSVQTLYGYDKGNLTSTEIIQRSNSAHHYIYYKYDRKGRLTGKYCCEQIMEKSPFISTYRYNNNHVSASTITEKSHTGKETTNNMTFSYKYDKMGNWREIIKNVDGVPLYKWVREIEYY